MNTTPTLEALIEKIIMHDKNYPTHGVNCACMDFHIQTVRKLLYAKDPTNEERMRIDYVFRTAME